MHLMVASQSDHVLRQLCHELRSCVLFGRLLSSEGTIDAYLPPHKCQYGLSAPELCCAAPIYEGTYT